MKNDTLLSGKLSDSFSDQCYKKLLEVKSGELTTYKELGNAIGTTAYRAVGTAMAKNPHAPKVPCHRVIRSDGEIGEYALGKQKKIALLRKEGIEIKGDRIINLSRYLKTFSDS